MVLGRYTKEEVDAVKEDMKVYSKRGQDAEDRVRWRQMLGNS